MTKITSSGGLISEKITEKKITQKIEKIINKVFKKVSQTTGFAFLRLKHPEQWIKIYLH